MISLPGILKPIGTATAANLIGRAANVLVALSVITLCGADTWTDRFFFILAIAFFFFGTVANAITTATTPLIISGKLILNQSSICLAGVSGTTALWAVGAIWNWLVDPVPSGYILAIGLMSGAGIANGFATGTHYARESFLLPGVTWSLRLIPLALFVALGPLAEKLAWLAIGIGMTDWIRFGLLVRGSVPSAVESRQNELITMARAFPSYGKVIAASVIMGLNPIIDRLIAGLSGPGAISILEAGERIYMMLASVSTIGVMAVLLTRLSREAADAQLESNWPHTIRITAAWNGFWVLVGVAVGYWCLAWWLDAFTPLPAGDARSAQWVYWCYLIGLPAFGFGLTYVKRLQALQRWWVMVGTSVLAVIINIPASLILRRWMGIPGIALATTLIYSINLLVLMFAVYRYPPGSD